MKLLTSLQTAAFCASLLGLAAVSAAEPNYQTDFTLRNGMKVIVLQDHRAPVAVQMVFYRAGAIDETNGPTGIAHMTEHMMFKATKTLKQGEFSEKVAQMGGQENAFTTSDFTAYYQEIGKEHLGEVMKFESDRMQNLQFSQAEFDKERRVVEEERYWRVDGVPASLLVEQLNAASFNAHPYHHPVIGWLNDIKQYKLDDVRSWYHRWYAPNNATLVVSGDVDPAQVRLLAERTYGRIPARALPERRILDEAAQIGVRRIEVKAPAENPLLALAFRVPSLEKDMDKPSDTYALDVLAAVLSGYPNARLDGKLVREERLANSIEVSYDFLQRGPSQMFFFVEPAKGVELSNIQAKIQAEIKNVAEHGISDTELSRVKARVVADQTYRRDSLMGQTRTIGMMEMAGVPYNRFNDMVDHLRHVTAEQVQAVAARYFSNDQLTVGVLSPLPLAQKEQRGPAPDIRH